MLGCGASSPLLFLALPHAPSVQHKAGAGSDSERGSATRRGRGCVAGVRPWAECRLCLWGGVIPPSVSPFSVSPVRETLRWQSRARRPWEVGGVWPSSARPPSIVSGSRRWWWWRWPRWRAPAGATGGRDAPALGGGAGRLPQSQCKGFGAAAGSSSRGPEEGDAACACPALLPPREMNMSLPGRVSCSMLNCFVSAACFSPPPLLRVSQLLSPAPVLSRLPQIRPVLEAGAACGSSCPGSARPGVQPPCKGGSPSPPTLPPTCRRRMPWPPVVLCCCPARAQGHSGLSRPEGPGERAVPRRLRPVLAWIWKITV